MYTEEEMIQFRLNCLKEKKEFVEDLGKTLSRHRTSINKLDYDVFTKDGYECEYLVVTYDGGAIATRNCRGNSLSAIFDEVSKLLDGGYYDEVRTYYELKKGSKPILGLSCE